MDARIKIITFANNLITMDTSEKDPAVEVFLVLQNNDPTRTFDAIFENITA